MDLKYAYMEEDLFPMNMTSYEKRPYGILFYNKENKDSYDSNHALIYKDKIENLHEVLQDIKNFYKEKGTNAIIYQSMMDNHYFEDIKDELTKEGYKSWSEEQRYMLPLAENQLVPNKDITVKQVDSWDDSFTQIFLEAEEPWEIDVVKSSLKNDNAWSFVAFINEKPIGILYGHLTDKVCRGDYLLVSKKHRGIGAGRAIFNAYVEWCKKENITNAYLWPDGETPERIYYEAGYRLAEVRLAGRAVYELKQLRLIKASKEYKKQIADMLEEWYATGEKIVPYAIRRLDYHDFDSYCQNIEIKDLSEGMVLDSTFFCLDEERNIIVGAVNIRHFLNESLLLYGGHIGDGVRPSERRKGIATKMIALALDECRKLGIYRVLMVCDKDNIGSAKSIQNNGGILEDEPVVDGIPQQRYWINLADFSDDENVEIIRRMSIDEIPECVEVIKKSFQTVADEFGFTSENAPRFTAFATEEGRLYYQFQTEKRPMFVYLRNGKIVGYYSLAFLENQECELNNLCVLPEYRHFCIGEKILKHCFQTVKSNGIQKLKIGIVEENKLLRAWYEKMGFKHTGVQKYDFFPFTCGYMEMDM